MRVPDPTPLSLPPRRPGLLARLRANFLAGLVVVALHGGDSRAALCLFL